MEYTYDTAQQRHWCATSMCTQYRAVIIGTAVPYTVCCSSGDAIRYSSANDVAWLIALCEVLVFRLGTVQVTLD